MSIIFIYFPSGILVQGSNGEAQHLSLEERKRAIKLTRETLDQNGYQGVVVIAGTGTQSTRETIQLCFDAKESGGTHALVLTPSTWAPAMNSSTIVRFHKEVADASPIPTMVYNFPTVTAGIDLDSDTISELATHPNIVGTKLSCGNIGKLHRLTSRFPTSGFSVFPGKSDVLLQALLSGSTSGIVALSNIVPKLHYKMLELFKAGKIQEAFEIQAKLCHADWAVGKLGGIGALKIVVMENFGYGSPVVRGPLIAKSPSSLVVQPHYATLQEVIAQEKELPDVLAVVH